MQPTLSPQLSGMALTSTNALRTKLTPPTPLCELSPSYALSRESYLQKQSQGRGAFAMFIAMAFHSRKAGRVARQARPQKDARLATEKKSQCEKRHIEEVRMSLDMLVQREVTHTQVPKARSFIQETRKVKRCSTKPFNILMRLAINSALLMKIVQMSDVSNCCANDIMLVMALMAIRSNYK